MKLPASFRYNILGLVLLSPVVGPAWLRAADDKPVAKPTTLPEEQRVVRLTAEHPETKEQLLCLVDITAAPEVEKWATEAGHYALKWYPVIEKTLASENYKPTREFRLVFKPMDGVAHALGNTIVISTHWIKKHPDDFGMVAHELTHVIQRYRRGEGWLTEGIADYVRYYVVEPGSKRARFDISRSSYKNAYQPAAGFIDWLERTKGPGIVSKLNTALRAGKYRPEVFKEVTGGTPDELWDLFVASKKEPQKQQAGPTGAKP